MGPPLAVASVRIRSSALSGRILCSEPPGARHGAGCRLLRNRAAPAGLKGNGHGESWMERGSGWRQAARAPADAADAADPANPARRGAPHPGRRGGPVPDRDRLLPGRAGRGGGGPALRQVRADHRAGPSLQGPLRRGADHQGAGPAPAQDGVRVPDRARRCAPSTRLPRTRPSPSRRCSRET